MGCCVIGKSTSAFPIFPSFGISWRPMPMFRLIFFDVLAFDFQRFSSARNIAQENATKEAGHFRNAVKEPKLFVNSFGKAIFINRISADAIFKSILLLIVINFIQVM